MSKSKQFLGRKDVSSLERGLEALQASPEFRGPVEQLDGHHCNDHFAQIYETKEEQLTTAVPFVRQGLAQGERCMYVVDERSEEEIIAAMRDAGVDVDAALESGSLSFHTIQDTYLRNGSFAPDEMIEFYAAAIDQALEGYEALRIVAGTTWLQEDETTIEDFMEYESKINDLFVEENSIALCQYDRDAFPPETIRNIVQTHPHLIYDGTVCHNFYYTPPEEFFGPDRPAREVDRMMRTLVDRTEAKTKLQERQRFLREQYEITADPDRSFEEKLQALFELGCERFDLELGAMARIDPAADRFEIEHLSDDHEHFEPGLELPLSETYCTAAVDSETAASVSDPVEGGYDDITVHEDFGLQAYLGTRVEIDGDLDRTFFFVSSEPREVPFTEEERTFQQLMGQWVKYELERRRREQYLQESYEITSDPALTFEEKLERLFELGCERFGLEMAGLNHLPSWNGPLRLEQGVGLDVDPADEPLWTDPDEGCFCRQTITEDAPVSLADVRGTDWEDDQIHRKFGLTSYLGTKVSSGSTLYGTLWFGSTEPRERSFSDAERTFIELMGQWVSYEIQRREQKRYQRELCELASRTDLGFEEKLQDLFELGCKRFDLELGGVARVDPEADLFEVEAISGEHEHLVPGARVDLSETYCRVFADCETADGVSEAVDVSDPADSGFEDTLAYEEFGVKTYLGTRIQVDGALDRTLFFVSSEPRDEEFSDADRAFHRLMGQWVNYELEREHRESQLAALNEMSRDLMNAETQTEIAESTVRHAQETLKLPVTALVDYSKRTGDLSPTAQTPRAEDELPAMALCERGSGPFWEAFVDNEVRVVTDIASISGAGDDVTEAVAVALGKQGLFVTATRAPEGFSEAELDFVAATAATVEDAYTRADREQLLHERERTLEEQNETLERLNRINDIIRNIDQALVQASNRAEVEAVVCEHLADAGPYELAWVGEHDAISREVTPREWAGTEQGYLDEITVTTDDSPQGRGPTGSAMRTREPQVVNDILSEAEFEPWRQDALNHGYHACVSLPLVYDDSLYGVLNVYAGQPGVFDELETTVLSELADNIAYAINAVESKKALLSDEIRELEFTVEDESLGPTVLTDEIDCELSLENVVHRTDGGLRAFVSVRKVSSAEVLAFMPQLPSADFELISEYDDGSEPVGLFEATVNDGSLAAMVQEHGGRLHEMHAVDGTATVTVHLAADANVREFVEMLRRVYPDSELVAQRTRERVQQTSMEFSASVAEELTSRQMEVLQTAYYSGYFDQPRARTGSEIAASMDISQPTLNTHLRTAQRKLYRKLFEESLFA